MNRKEMLDEIKWLQAENKRLEQRCDSQNEMLNQLHHELAQAPSKKYFDEVNRQLAIANEEISIYHFLERAKRFMTIQYIPESEGEDDYTAEYWTLEEAGKIDIESYSLKTLIEKWKAQKDA